ncbi:MAG TPA: hypothetical protein VNJ02_19885 [Vicinamibacterales bacterium]|nr:hypothetical protein [Vicinamibacterales bacterium]
MTRPRVRRRTASPAATVVVAIACAVVSVTAQVPQLAGTWKLDAAGSQIVDGAGLAGLIGAGAPPMLHITQPANGQVIVESPVNEGHVRNYQPGAKTATPVGQGGTITMTSQWTGNRLSSEGTSVGANGATATIRETYSVTSDGSVLTIAVTTGASDAKTSALKYTRIRDVGPCERWPTPCKRAP